MLDLGDHAIALGHRGRRYLGCATDFRVPGRALARNGATISVCRAVMRAIAIRKLRHTHGGPALQGCSVRARVALLGGRARLSRSGRTSTAIPAGEYQRERSNYYQKRFPKIHDCFQGSYAPPSTWQVSVPPPPIPPPPVQVRPVSSQPRRPPHRQLSLDRSYSNILIAPALPSRHRRTTPEERTNLKRGCSSPSCPCVDLQLRLANSHTGECVVGHDRRRLRRLPSVGFLSELFGHHRAPGASS